MTAEISRDDGLDPGFNKPFVEHLEDLRKVILWSVVFLVAGLIIAIPFAPQIIALTKNPVRWAGRNPDEFLRIIHIAGGFTLAMKVIFWTGLLISAAPVMICIAHFIFPGLKTGEKCGARIAVFSSVFLFAGGAALCYYITLPVALRMMFAVNAWLELEAPWVEIGDYVSFVLKLLLAFGATFELPVILSALGWVGILSSASLRKWRRHAVIAILIIAMLLTPPDIFTQIFMALPMLFLYEISIIIIRFQEKKVDLARNRS